MTSSPRRLIFASFLFLYVFTRTAVYSYDAITYALSLEFLHGLLLFHPYHLFALLPGLGLYRGLSFLGLPVRALYVMQFINIIAACGALTLFFSVVARRHDNARALATTFLLGTLYVYWYESIDAGSYALASLVVAWLLFEMMRPGELRPVWIGVIMGVSITIHGMMVAVLPACFYLLWKRRSLSSAAVAVGIALAIAMSSYLCVLGLFYSGSAKDALSWIFGPPAAAPGMSVLNNPMWQFDVLPNIRAFGRAWADSFIMLRGMPIRLVWASLFFVLTAVVFVLIARRLASEIKRIPEYGFFILWIFGECLIQFFYAPGIERFRLLFLPVALMLALELKPSWRVLAGCAFVSLSINLVVTFYPQKEARSNPNISRPKWVEQTLSPNDFLLFAGSGPDSVTNVYMAYFSSRIPARSFYGYLYSAPGGSLNGLDDYYVQAKNRGGEFFIEKAVFDPSNQRALEEQGRLPAGAIGQWLAKFAVTRELAFDNYHVISVRLARN